MTFGRSARPGGRAIALAALIAVGAAVQWRLTFSKRPLFGGGAKSQKPDD